MSQPVLAQRWALIKESIRLVAKEFIARYPHFEDFILSYCKEIDYISPVNARKRLRTLFTRLDQEQGLDKQTEFLRREIAEKAARSERDGKKICIRAVRDGYRASYITFAMKYILWKCEDGTLTYDQAFNGEEVKRKIKTSFIKALNQEFAIAHPWETQLQEQHDFARNEQLRDLRFRDLLSMFRKQHQRCLIQPGLHLLVNAASAISENSALSGPSARCLLQFFSSFHCRSSSLTLTWVATAAARVLWNRRCASPAALRLYGCLQTPRRPRPQV
jgi:hypothetical protein